MNYYINTKLHTTFEKTVQLVTQALKTEGFGILTEINIHEKLKEKLGVDFRKYKILGACNPAYAYKALQKEDKIGTMLPCNVIIQELANNEIEVAAILVNDIPTYRMDQMPYGGVKNSGFGREGPKYAIEEMTEMRMLVINRDGGRS